MRSAERSSAIWERALHKKAIRRKIVVIAFALIVLLVIVPQLSGFEQSYMAIKQANAAAVAIGFGFVLATYVIAALLYKVLALRVLPFGPAVLVQLAGALINRLLPAGIGGLGLNAVFLRRRGYSLPAAGAVVAVNTVVGVAGNLVLLIAALGVVGVEALKDMQVRSSAFVVIAALVLCVMVALFAARKMKKAYRYIRMIHQFVRAVGMYRSYPGRLIAALGLAVVLTACNTAALWFTAQAFDVSLSFAMSILVFSFGILISTSTPTPGGVVGAEAALTGALVAAGVSASVVFRIAVVFRVITYWLPAVIGGGAFVFVRRKNYI